MSETSWKHQCDTCPIPTECADSQRCAYIEWLFKLSAALTESLAKTNARRPAMTDTLPSDLRRHAKLRTLSLPVADTMLRAADEIEQLRAARPAPAVDGDAGWPDWRHHDTTEERRRIMSRALAAADRATGGSSVVHLNADLVERVRKAFGDALTACVNMLTPLGDIPVQAIREAMSDALGAEWVTVAMPATHETPGAAGVAGGADLPTHRRAPNARAGGVYTGDGGAGSRITAKQSLLDHERG